MCVCACVNNTHMYVLPAAESKSSELCRARLCDNHRLIRNPSDPAYALISTLPLALSHTHTHTHTHTHSYTYTYTYTTYAHTGSSNMSRCCLNTPAHTDTNVLFCVTTCPSNTVVKRPGMFKWCTVKRDEHGD